MMSLNATENEQQNYGFEGSEKRLVLLFNGRGNLKNIDKSEWVEILKHAKCSILNTISNTQCIAHLLSESSLFIFKKKLMIKTCGTTSLLLILPVIISKCKEINLCIENVVYSRAKFRYPNKQPVMYQAFKNESSYLNQYFDGCETVLGSSNKAKWHCYCNKNSYNKQSKTLEIVLFDLSLQSMKYFFSDFEISKKDLDQHVVDGCCIPDTAMIDAYSFSPCGYSLNAILDNNYWAIHITPEKDSSFVSFETDYQYDNYKFVIQNIIDLFKPNRFSVAVNTFNLKRDMNKYKFDQFILSDSATHKFSKYHDIKWATYIHNIDMNTDHKTIAAKDIIFGKV